MNFQKAKLNGVPIEAAVPEARRGPISTVGEVSGEVAAEGFGALTKNNAAAEVATAVVCDTATEAATSVAAESVTSVAVEAAGEAVAGVGSAILEGVGEVVTNVIGGIFDGL